MGLCTVSGVLAMSVTMGYWELNQQTTKTLKPNLLMKRFLQDNFAFSFTQFNDSIGQFFVSRINVTGSVRETIAKGIDLPKQYQHTVLDSSDKTVLQEMIGKMHECPSFEVTVNCIACKYKSVNVNGRRFSAIRSSSCVALAQWERDLFGSPQISPLTESMSHSLCI